MVKYWLGDLPGEQQTLIEQLFFADDQLFNDLLAVKEKLIDDYLHNLLNKRDHELFERNFLSSPKHREQVEFASALMKRLSTYPAQDE